MEWDFFLAHASPDSPTAERLRSLLEPRATVFEDSMLEPGEEWDVALDRHLRASRITVVLVSRHTEAARYLREEIARAVNLTREDTRRRVVPLVLEAVPLPYGLEICTQVRLSAKIDLAAAADTLLVSLRDVPARRSEGPEATAVQLRALFRNLDLDALGGVPSGVLKAAVDEVGGSDALWLHLRRRGLDPRVFLPSLPGHGAALARWSVDTADVPGAQDLPGAVLRQLRKLLVDERADLARMSLDLRDELLTGSSDSPDARRLEAALTAALPPVRSPSTEAVLVSPGVVEQAPGPMSPIRRAALSATGLRREPALVGRDHLVADLAERIRARLARNGHATAFLSGQLGAGVSAVAAEVAHVLAESFPGGVRHVDLKGMDEQARRAGADVVKLLCHSLGVDPVPGMAPDLLRDALSGNGVLLVLDNAFDPKQVESLVPAAPTCAVIVTSRNRVQGYADHDLVVHVPPLKRAASIRLLGQARPGADPVPLDRIAAACADLPMALRLIGAWIANHPDVGVHTIADDVEDERTRLALLDDEVLPMRLAIELSYRHLDEDARTAFRFLPAVPGSAATVDDLARGLERDSGDTKMSLYRLVDRSVAGYEELADLPRFRLFELVRLYALERLAADDPPDVVARFRKLVLTRLRDGLRTMPEPDVALRLDPAPLIAARDLAEREEWFDLAGDLTDDLRALHEAETDEEAVREDRLHSARLRQRSENPEEIAEAHLAVARATEGQAAENAFADAERVATQAGLLPLVGRVAFELAAHCEARADLTGALAAGKRAVDALCAAGLRATAVPAANNNVRLALRLPDHAAAEHWVGTTWELMDARTPASLRAEAAFDAARAATDSARSLSRWRIAVATAHLAGDWANAGLAACFGACEARNLFRHAEAASLLRMSADMHRRAGDRNREAWALVELAAVHAVIGQHVQAREVLTGVEDGGFWHRGVAAEVALRVAALSYLADGGRVAPPAIPADEGGRAVGLILIAAVLSRPEPDRTELAAFVESPMVYQPPPHQPRLHRSLGEEPPAERGPGRFR